MELQSQLGQFFGSDQAPPLTWAADPGLTDQSPLSAQEEELVASSALKRQREFRSGRNLAHRLLKERNLANSVLLRCPRGAPLWPDGVVGSLSHCDDLAVCVTANNLEIEMLGVDAELGGPIDAELLGYVINDADLVGLPPCRDKQADWGKRVFSAKEASYKALFPRLQVVLEFSDLSIQPVDKITANIGRFKVAHTGRRAELRDLCNLLEGRWLVTPQHVFTLVWASCR